MTGLDRAANSGAHLCPTCLKGMPDPDSHTCEPETKPINKDLSKQIPEPHSPQGDIEHK